MNFFDKFSKKKLLAAHRGYRALYPENTMLSFEKALGRCDFLEFDVQLTKDKIPIVFHDDKLFRCTDILKFKEYMKEKKFYINSYTFEELQQFDVSSWFYKTNPFNEILEETNTIQRIPSLEEVLVFAKKNTLALNIEIKFNKKDRLKNEDLKVILEMVKKHNYQNEVIISSFHHKYLKKIKKLDSTFSTAALAHERYPKNNVKYLKKLGVDAYHTNHKLAQKEIIENMIEDGIVVNVYTVNNKEQQKILYGCKVKAIFSDYL